MDSGDSFRLKVSIFFGEMARNSEGMGSLEEFISILCARSFVLFLGFLFHSVFQCILNLHHFLHLFVFLQRFFELYVVCLSPCSGASSRSGLAVCRYNTFYHTKRNFQVQLRMLQFVTPLHDVIQTSVSWVFGFFRFFLRGFRVCFSCFSYFLRLYLPGGKLILA